MQCLFSNNSYWSKEFVSILKLICKESFGLSKTQTLKQFRSCKSMHLNRHFLSAPLPHTWWTCTRWGGGVCMLQGVGASHLPEKQNAASLESKPRTVRLSRQRKMQALFSPWFQQLRLPSLWDQCTLFSNSRRGGDCVTEQQIEKQRMLMQRLQLSVPGDCTHQEPRTPGSGRMRWSWLSEVWQVTTLRVSWSLWWNHSVFWLLGRDQGMRRLLKS